MHDNDGCQRGDDHGAWSDKAWRPDGRHDAPGHGDGDSASQ